MRDWMDDGAPNFVTLSRRVQRTQKPRLCEWCGGQITVGEKYLRDTYLEDGAFKTTVGHPFGGACAMNELTPAKEGSEDA